jgi:hypothetical protein
MTSEENFRRLGLGVIVLEEKNGRTQDVCTGDDTG